MEPGRAAAKRHDNFVETATRCAEAGEWRDWANLFTEDAHYVEHMFGEMHGREEIHRGNRGHHGRVAQPGHDLVPPRLVLMR